MSTVDDVLASSLAHPTPDSADRAAGRGRLIVTERAARHLVRGVAERAPLRTRDVDVDVDHLDESGIGARVEFAAAYPDSALSSALVSFREHLAHEVQRLLGRPVVRLDVVVTDLVVDIEPRRRVQ
jgi:hypothetical protein